MEIRQRIDWTNVVVGLLLALLPALVSTYVSVQIAGAKLESFQRELDQHERDIRELRQRGKP